VSNYFWGCSNCSNIYNFRERRSLQSRNIISCYGNE